MWKVFKYLIWYYVVTILLIISSSFIYSKIYGIEALDQFFIKYQSLLVIVLGLIFIPILSKEYKKFSIKSKKISYKPILLLGFTLPIIYNTIIYYLIPNNMFNKTNIIISLICSGFIGPIIEELLFRGIIYNELKKKYKIMTSILITSIVFALIHGNIITIFYTFGLSFLLIYVYEKDKNILSPIILHVICNTISTLYSLILIKNIFILNYLIFIISLILVIIYKKVKKWI